MELIQNITLHNKFDIQVVDAKSGEIKQNAIAHNVITDAFFQNRLPINQSSKASNSISYIKVGTGTGTPSVNDTELFQRLFSKEVDREYRYNYPTSEVISTIKINADEYNGYDFTEVGLDFVSYNSNSLCTHAMIKDSEGNLISIHKTDEDVVYIISTFYVTCQNSGFGNNALYPTSDSIRGIVKWILDGKMFWVNTTGFEYDDTALIISPIDVEDISDFAINRHASKSVSLGNAVGHLDTLSMDLPITILLDTEYNNHIIKAIGFPSIGIMRFPDSSIFPNYKINPFAIGTGDGTTKEFNVKCPLIVENSEEVFLDGVKVDKNEYDFDYDNNCVDYLENYYTASMKCDQSNVSFGDIETREPWTDPNYSINSQYRRWVKDPLYLGYYPGYRITQYPQYVHINEDYPILIDFGELKKCNRLFIGNVSNEMRSQRGSHQSIYVVDSSSQFVTYDITDSITIEYSNDGENWIEVQNLYFQYFYVSDADYSGYYVFYWDIAEGRYWRIYGKNVTYEAAMPLSRYESSEQVINSTTTGRILYEASGVRDIPNYPPYISGNSDLNYGGADRKRISGFIYLGKSTPGLKFHTPPAANQVVSVGYSINVPFKTENNLIKFTFSIRLQRG